ncbi:MAG: hypothetical protein R3B48_25110 [Kofleriaceae bacterium]
MRDVEELREGSHPVGRISLTKVLNQGERAHPHLREGDQPLDQALKVGAHAAHSAI